MGWKSFHLASSSSNLNFILRSVSCPMPIITIRVNYTMLISLDFLGISSNSFQASFCLRIWNRWKLYFRKLSKYNATLFSLSWLSWKWNVAHSSTSRSTFRKLKKLCHFQSIIAYLNTLPRNSCRIYSILLSNSITRVWKKKKTKTKRLKKNKNKTWSKCNRATKIERE